MGHYLVYVITYSPAPPAQPPQSLVARVGVHTHPHIPTQREKETHELTRRKSPEPPRLA